MLGQATASKIDQQLFLFGGGKRSIQALEEMRYQSKSVNPSVLIITWASSLPEESFNEIKADFILAGLTQINHSLTLEQLKESGQQKHFFSQAMKAEIVFFGGGDQNRILDFLDLNQNFIRLFRTSYNRGTIFAGTSAGTAIMSHRAICGSEDETKIGPETTCLRNGLGLIPQGVLVDQHFIRRSRYNRIFSALIYQPDLVKAYGVDEDSTLWIKNNRPAKVFGMAIEVTKNRRGFQTVFLGSSPALNAKQSKY